MDILATPTIPTNADIEDRGLRLGDTVTARMFGQYITMTRAGWLDFAEQLRPSDDESGPYSRIVRRIVWQDAE